MMQCNATTIIIKMYTVTVTKWKSGCCCCCGAAAGGGGDWIEAHSTAAIIILL
jgi:hypothetical protein